MIGVDGTLRRTITSGRERIKRVKFALSGYFDVIDLYDY